MGSLWEAAPLTQLPLQSLWQELGVFPAPNQVQRRGAGFAAGLEIPLCQPLPRAVGHGKF